MKRSINLSRRSSRTYEKGFSKPTKKGHEPMKKVLINLQKSLSLQKVLTNLQKGLFNKLTKKGFNQAAEYELILCWHLENAKVLDFFTPLDMWKKILLLLYFFISFRPMGGQQIPLEGRLTFLGKKFSVGIAFSHTSQLQSQTSHFSPPAVCCCFSFYLPL